MKIAPIHTWRERIDDKMFAANATCQVRKGRSLYGLTVFLLLPQSDFWGYQWAHEASEHLRKVASSVDHGHFTFVGGVRLPYIRRLLSGEPV